MLQPRPAIYVVMACAFGACTLDDDNSYCEKPVESSCVCKPTMKLDMTSVENPTSQEGALCNNATFEWMVQTLLVEISQLKERTLSQSVDIEKFKETVDILQNQNKGLNEVIRHKDTELENEKRRNRELNDDLEKLNQEKALNSKREDAESLKETIRNLERSIKKLDFENLQLKERNDLINEELDSIHEQNKEKPRDCADIQAEGFRYSGVFTIHPQGTGDEAIDVFCDLHTKGGGWLMIQRRQDGSQKFDVDWQAYKKGFGKVAREFWLGNEMLHRITHQGEYELRIDMMDMTGKTGHAHYKKFAVAGEQEQYKLTVEGYSGNVGDSMSHHNESPFSSRDVDNDESRSGHCSQLYGYGGWWYVRCYDANLNGRYGVKDNTGIIWFHWGETYRPLKHVEMKIRPVQFTPQED